MPRHGGNGGIGGVNLSSCIQTLRHRAAATEQGGIGGFGGHIIKVGAPSIKSKHSHHYVRKSLEHENSSSNADRIVIV